MKKLWRLLQRHERLLFALFVFLAPFTVIALFVLKAEISYHWSFGAITIVELLLAVINLFLLGASERKEYLPPEPVGGVMYCVECKSKYIVSDIKAFTQCEGCGGKLASREERPQVYDIAKS